MKIGIGFNPYGNGHARYGDDKFVKIKKHGFSAIDFNMANTETDIYTLPEDDLCEKMTAFKTEAAEAGIEISQVHGPWRYPPRDCTDEDRAERTEKMKRSILACKMLGCKNWVVHPIMPFGINDLDTGKESETWELNVKFLSELVSFAKQHEVTVCLENMPFTHFSISKPEKILKLVKEIDSENLKVCLDTGHVAVFPELSIGNEVHRLGDYLKVLHVHDNMGDRDAHLWPTKGVIDWAEFATALKKTGYTGIFSLETSASATLGDDEFEKQTISLFEIAKKITEY